MSSETTALRDDPPGGLALLYGVLFSARETFAVAPLERSLGLAAGVVAMVAFVGAASGAAVGGGMLFLSFLTWLGNLVISWLVLTGVLFVVSRIIRAQGDFVPLLAATGLAFLPWIFLGPLAVFGRWGTVGMAIAAIGLIGVFVWFIRTLVAGVRGATGLSTAQSLMALVATELVLVVLPAAAFTLMIMGLVVLASAA